jgi:hypothetical protein
LASPCSSRQEEGVAFQAEAGQVRERLRVPLDRDVQVGDLAAEQQVANHSADEVRRHPVGDLAKLVDRIQRVDELAQPGGIDVG